MKPERQIACVALMVAAGNWSARYARALFAATRMDHLASPDHPKKVVGLTSEQMGRMEWELGSVQEEFERIESSYGDDVLNLIIARGYIRRLVVNPEVERFLSQRHSDMLQEFRAIIAATSLEEGLDAAA